MSRFQKIADLALTYLGEKEIPGNKGFENTKFASDMTAVGWYIGAPWCAFFARLIWKKCGQDFKLMNGSAVRTYKSLVESEKYSATTEPVVGALVVWRSYKAGKPLSTGHIGIVTSVSKESFTSVEGNTTASGGREGLVVSARQHGYEWTKKDGLRLLGFINPI